MKTISMFLRASKTEAEEAGIETEGMAESVSKLRKEILALSKVDIMLDDRTYKSTYDILKELSKVWDEISDVSQANILEKLGGKRNANVVASIIENFDVAENALVTAQDSLGSATKENEKYLESIEGHLNRLKVSFEELSQTVMSSDLIKNGIGFLTDATSLLNDFIQATGSLSIPAAFAGSWFFNKANFGLGTLGGVGDKGQTLFTVFGKTKEQWGDLYNTILNGSTNLKAHLAATFKTPFVALGDNIKNAFGYMSKQDITTSTNQLTGFVNALEGVANNAALTKEQMAAVFEQQIIGNGVFANAKDITKAEGQAIITTMAQYGSYEDQIKAAKTAVDNFGNKQTEMASKIKVSTLAVNGLKSAVATLLPMLAVTVISTIITQIKKANEEAERLKEEAISASKSQVESLSEIYKKLSEINEEYKQNQLDKESYTKSTEELVDKLRDEGVEVDNLIKKYDDLGTVLQRVTINEISKNLPNVREGLENTADEFKKGLEKVAQQGQNAIGGATLPTFFNVDTENTGLHNVLSTWVSKQSGAVRQGGGYDISFVNNILKDFYNSYYKYREGKITQDEFLTSGKNYYEQLTELRDAIYEASREDQSLLETDIYKDLQTRISELSSTYNELSDSIDNYNERLSTVIVGEKKLAKETPKTYNEYLLYRNDIIESASKDYRFKGTQDDINRALEYVLKADSAFSNFEKRYQEISNISKRIDNGIIPLDEQQSIIDYISGLDDGELSIAVTLDDEELKSGLDNIITTIHKKSVDAKLEALKTDGYVSITDEVDAITKAQGKLKPIYDELANSQGDVVLTLEQSKVLIEEFGDEAFKSWEKVDETSGRIVMSAEDLQTLYDTFKNGQTKNISKMISDVEEYLSVLNKAHNEGTYSGTEQEYAAEKSSYEQMLENLKVRKNYLDQFTLLNSKVDEYANTLEYCEKLNSQLSNYNTAQRLVNNWKVNNDYLAEFEKQAKALAEFYSGTDIGAKLNTAIEYWENNNRTQEAAQHIVDIFKEAYDEDVRNFNTWQSMRVNILKGADDSYIWREFISKNNELVNNLKSIYDYDLTNCKTWLELRDDIIKNHLHIDITQIKSSDAIADIYKAAENSKPYQDILASYYNFLDQDTEPFDNGGNVTSQAESDYNKKLNKLKDANTGTLEAEQEFVKKWIALNDKMFAATDPEKYKENLDEIASYVAGLSSTISTHLEKWAQDFNHNDNAYADRLVYIEEWKNSSQSLFSVYDTLVKKYEAISAAGGDATETLKALHDVAKAIDDDTLSRAKYDADTYKQGFEEGRYDYNTYKSKIQNLGNTYKRKDGGNLLDGTFYNGYINADMEFEYISKEAAKNNDKTLKSELNYVKQIKDYLKSTFGDITSEFYNPKKFEEEYQKIIDYEFDALKTALEEGKITYQDYIDYTTKALEEADIFGVQYVTEAQKEVDKARASREKSYWEQQKNLATQYYDEELEKLRDIQDEEERINKAEELRLNLIKARQKLEEAKSQKNQLVFHDGTFEYMADQDAIMSAEEEVSEALKAIKDNELQEQIQLLQDQKDDALLFYSNVIGLLEYYINGTLPIEGSDSDILTKAMESSEGNYFLKLMRGEIKMDEIDAELKKKMSKDSSSDSATDTAEKLAEKGSKFTKSAGSTALSNTAEKLAEKGSNWLDSILNLDINGLFNAASNFMSTVSKFDAVGLDNGYAQEATTSAINNVYNNSNVSEDHSVNVGDIHMVIQGGTSEEMLNQFASKLASTITTIVPKMAVSH